MTSIASDAIVDGRYKLVNRIGSGGMADVWCAEDLQLGRQVALKLLHRRFAEDEDFVERFRREASSAAGLQHPNVVAVYDRGEWDGTYYIAMEFLEGETLKDLILREAPLPPDRAIDLTVQVLRAARFAHRRGIIHRDLKPQNVIVDREDRAKVTDFGIARSGPSDMTETGSIMGTAQYLSPEQAQGTAVVPQSDLYAVGIMLYEMLTGRLPFDGDSPVTIALKQVSEEPIPPSHLLPSVSPQLEGTVLHALAKDPDRRFPDADDFIAALEASRASAAPLPGDATTAFAAVGASEPAHPYVPLAPDDRGGPRRWWPWALLAAVLVAGAVVAALLLTRQELRSVPSVTGADVAAAARRLRNDGFKPVVERVRNAAERDKVIAQDPSPGRRLAVGQDVTLTVSDGPGTRAVTDVEGESARTARARLRRAGFRVRERRETSADVPADRVVRTMPPIGSEIEVGGTVTVVVSSGPEQVAVPDLRGSDLADARAELADAGLEADVTRQESDKDPGTVLTQSKPPGTRVDKGSTITLTVAKQPKAVPVPDVVGDEESAAVAKIQNAELGVDVRDKQVGSPSQDGKVQSQSPAGGGKLERGKTVTITVGRFNPDLNPEGGGTSTTPTGTSTTPAPAPDTGAGGATSTTPGATPGAR